MNEEPRSDAINDGGENEEKRRDHSTEFIRSVRYAKGICCSRVFVRRAGGYCKHLGASLPTGKRLQLVTSPQPALC
jgi:hypothetical protein